MSKKKTAKSAEELDREKVIQRLYREALELDWLHLSQHEHKRQYERWIDAPEVGGVLEKWKDREGLRVWLKDVPMKEFARALAGQGDFARFLDHHPHSAELVVSRSLGEGWSIEPGTLDVKPLQCFVRKGQQRRWLTWGAKRDFKELLYAGLVHWDGANGDSIVVVVHDSLGAPLQDAQRALFERLARKVGFEFKSIRL